MTITACSTNTNSAKISGSPSPSSSTESKKSPVLDMYKKVNLGMTKDQVDSLLAVEPKAETNEYALKNTFNYEDMNTGFGVIVIYNNNKQVYSKTVILSSNAEIAYLCKKTVKKDRVDKITKGMDYKDVINILGGEGVECSFTGKESDFTSIGVIRRWANKDGSGIQVVFSKDDKVEDALFFD